MKAVTKTQLTNILLNAHSFADDYGTLTTHKSLINEDTFTLQSPEGETITCLFEEAEIEGTLLRVIEDVTGDLKVFTVLATADVAQLMI